MEGLTLAPMGVLLSLVFVGSMSMLFRWMFTVPPLMPRLAVTARRSVTTLRRILVPVVEAVASERAVELAARMGEAQKAAIILANVVEVPLTMPLTAPMPEAEARGKEALDVARTIVARHNLPVSTRVVRERHAADGILRIAREEEVNAIVMGIGVKRRLMPAQIGSTIMEVLRRAQCEVVIDKAPLPGGTTPLTLRPHHHTEQPPANAAPPPGQA
ncbi:MAG: universal stress protein [Chloroflexi bacterium]|nr:universal stress protein [Chloroflexota bacterium]